MVTPTNVSDEKIKAAAEDIAARLESAGYQVLLDDRDERPGVKFKDADLVGIPFRVTVGKKVTEGTVEVVRRSTRQMEDASIAAITEYFDKESTVCGLSDCTWRATGSGARNEDWFLAFSSWLPRSYLIAALAPPFFSNYQFEDAIKTESQMSTYTTKTEDVIRDEVFKKAQELDVPITKEQIKVVRNGVVGTGLSRASKPHTPCM